jgi:hypothetical protein
MEAQNSAEDVDKLEDTDDEKNPKSVAEIKTNNDII